MASIGGRTNVARVYQPPGPLPQMQAAEIGTPPSITITSSMSPSNATPLLTAGNSSVASTSIDGWDTDSDFATVAVTVFDSATGRAAVSIGTPTLSGCGMTWTLQEGPHAGHATVGDEVYGQQMVFTGTGTPSDGALTFGLGTTNARDVVVSLIIDSYRHVASIIQQAADAPGSAAVTASASLALPLTGNRVLGIVMDIGAPTYHGSFAATPSLQFHAGSSGGVTGVLIMASASGAGGYGLETLDLASDGQNFVWLVELAASLS